MEIMKRLEKMGFQYPVGLEDNPGVYNGLFEAYDDTNGGREIISYAYQFKALIERVGNTHIERKLVESFWYIVEGIMENHGIERYKGS